MVATAVSEEAQTTEAVTSLVDWSVKVPVAKNCSVLLAEIVGFVGVTASDTSVGAVTVSVAVPETPLTLAVMVEEPTLTPVASPMLLLVLLMVATLVVPEVQFAVAVTSLLVPSL
jgi:hypothetical protein